MSKNLLKRLFRSISREGFMEIKLEDIELIIEKTDCSHKEAK